MKRADRQGANVHAFMYRSEQNLAGIARLQISAKEAVELSRHKVATSTGPAQRCGAFLRGGCSLFQVRLNQCLRDLDRVVNAVHRKSIPFGMGCLGAD